MMFSNNTWALCVAPLLLLAGCGSRPDDKTIAQAVQSEIRKDAAIGGQVSAESAEGIVTLRGNVANDAARALAAKDAGAVAGVRGVVNFVIVGASADTPAVAATAKPSRVYEAAPRRSGSAKPVQQDPVPLATSQPTTPPAASTPAPPPPAVETAAATPPPAAPSLPPPPPPPPAKHKVPAGATLSVRLVDSVDSARNKAGDTFRGTLNTPIRVDGDIVIPAGANVEGRIVDAANAGRFSGHAELKLELTKLVTHGTSYPLQTESNDKAGNGRGKGTAETVGAGAALGAIIGAVAGGGKGAGIGTLAGAGAGGATRGVQSRQRIYYPSETVLSFRLQEGFTVTTDKAGASSSEPGDDSRPVLRR